MCYQRERDRNGTYRRDREGGRKMREKRTRATFKWMEPSQMAMAMTEWNMFEESCSAAKSLHPPISPACSGWWFFGLSASQTNVNRRFEILLPRPTYHFLSLSLFGDLRLKLRAQRTNLYKTNPFFFKKVIFKEPTKVHFQLEFRTVTIGDLAFSK